MLVFESRRDCCLGGSRGKKTSKAGVESIHEGGRYVLGIKLHRPSVQAAATLPAGVVKSISISNSGIGGGGGGSRLDAVDALDWEGELGFAGFEC